MLNKFSSLRLIFTVQIVIIVCSFKIHFTFTPSGIDRYLQKLFNLFNKGCVSLCVVFKTI